MEYILVSKNGFPAGGSSDPLTGIPFQSPVVLRPYLPLQQRIASWCQENGIEYEAQEWAAPSDGNEAASTVSACRKLLATFQALGKVLVSRRSSSFRHIQIYPLELGI